MALLRRALGDTLRGQRLRQQRTLREVSSAARVSLGYLSEVERGQKEASSELLAAICTALDVALSEVVSEASDTLRACEPRPESMAASGTPEAAVSTDPSALEPLEKVVIPALRADGRPESHTVAAA